MENTVASIRKAVLNRVRPEEHLQITLNAQEVLLGRSVLANIQFLVTKISRSEALFEYNFTSSQWTIRSQGLNGIWLNGSLIPKDTPTQLKSQDLIQIGPKDYYVYEFLSEDDEPQRKRSRLATVREVLELSQNAPSAQDTADLLKRLQDEKEELERRIGAAELHATETQEKMSRLLASFEDLKKEKTRLEERLKGERSQFEALISEMEGKLAQQKHDLEKWREEKAD